MEAVIKPLRAVSTPQREHSLSFHPIIRKVLAAGPHKMWGVKDLMELLDLSERSAQTLVATSLTNTAFPAQSSPRRRRYKATTGSLLLYLLQNSHETPQTEVLSALSVIVDQLPTSTLSQLVTFLQTKIQRRGSRPVLVVTEASSPRPAQFDLFS